MKQKFYPFLLFFFLIIIAQADNNIDSLLSILKGSKVDTTKVNIFNEVSATYDNMGEIGFSNSLIYGNKALRLAQKIKFTKGITNALYNIGNVYADQGNNEEALYNYRNSLKINEEIKNKAGIANCYNLIGVLYVNQGNYNAALENYLASLKINKEIGNQKGMVKNYNNIGVVYFNQSDYSKALTNYFSSLKIAQLLVDKKELAYDYNNIGTCFWRQGNYTEALNNQLKALKINEELGDKQGIALNNLNIGLIEYEQGNYDEALKYQFASLKINTELSDKPNIANNYMNIGLVYYDQGNYNEALKNQLISLKVNQELGNKNRIAGNYDNIGLIYFKQGNYPEALKNEMSSLEIYKELGSKEGVANEYINLGTVYTNQKKFEKAKEFIKKGLQISLEAGNKTRIKEGYIALAVLDSAQGNWKSAYDNNKMYFVYRDSLVNEVNTKKLVESRLNYEFDKKSTAEKLKQETKDAITAQQKQRQRVIIIAVSFGLLLVMIFSGLLYNRFRLTLKQKQVIEIQKREVEEQKELVEIQKELVEEKNKQVTDSINYAKRIQTAILPSFKTVKQYLPDSFILYLPKDIVAGDFYWMEKVGDTILFAACDCTGHGVPGAMVSVVCNNALNRAVREFNLIKPAAILDKIEEIVVENFAKSEDEINDGMDVSICSYNYKTKTLEYAGANNPLWLIRNGEIIETKADKQPIGRNERNHPFTNHEFALQQNDIFYLSSDGFADQFGGETGRKKLTRKRFKDLILSIQHIALDKQDKELEKFFLDYKKQVDQIDDILVMGVRFC